MCEGAIAAALLGTSCAEADTNSSASSAHTSVSAPLETSSTSTTMATASVSTSTTMATTSVSTSSEQPTAPPRCGTDMLLIPEARFVVGAATREAVERGSPSLIGAYCLDRTETPTTAYSVCVSSGVCTKPLKGGSCSFERLGAAQKPINCVTFQQANDFCAQAGKRLPTEAEWESAASGGTRTYPWGAEPPGKLVCWDGRENALGHGKRHDSCDVGAFLGDVTPEGVMDLGGNLSEWTMFGEPSRNAKDDQTQARKGGSWGTKSGPYLLRTTSRRVGDFKVYDSGIFTGFRCATDLR